MGAGARGNALRVTSLRSSSKRETELKAWLLIVWCVALLSLLSSLHAAAASASALANNAVVSSTTVVCDTFDSIGDGNGFITAKQATNGDWTWERLERQAHGGHTKVDPIVYRWTSSETSHVGEAWINAGDTTGEWEDKTAETTTNTEKAS